MEYETPDIYDNSAGEKRVGLFRRLARRVLDRLMPPAPYDPAKYVLELPGDIEDESTQGIDIGETPEPSITVTLDKEGAFFVASGESAPIGPLTTHYDSPKLFRELAAMYIPFGPGEYLADDITVQTKYKPSTISHITDRLTSLLPPEVISVTNTGERDKRIAFGNLVLASLLEDKAAPAEAEENPYKQTPERIDEGKLDLTMQAYAIIDTEGISKERFYLPLHSPAAMMAARVVESIKHLRRIGASKGVRSSEIAEHVWQRMTLAERQIFVDNEEAVLLSNASEEIELPVIRVLRRLTNRLMLTHEPRNDHFTLLGTTLSIQYSDQSLDEEEAAKLGNLRPIIPPEQRADEPTQEKQAEYMDLARAYMRQAKNRSPIIDMDAIDMLDFLMSPHGHWAVKAVAGGEGLFKTYDGAMYAMHTYLRVHFHGYGPAYRNRLISGNRRVRRGGRTGGVRQVSGAIPRDSNWILGHGMQEFFGETTVSPEET